MTDKVKMALKQLRDVFFEEYKSAISATIEMDSAGFLKFSIQFRHGNPLREISGISHINEPSSD